jgi:hypothetical protein
MGRLGGPVEAISEDARLNFCPKIDRRRQVSGKAAVLWRRPNRQKMTPLQEFVGRLPGASPGNAWQNNFSSSLRNFGKNIINRTLYLLLRSRSAHGACICRHEGGAIAIAVFCLPSAVIN